MGIFMLIPAELFKVTRPILPDGGFAPVQIVVAIAYVLAIIGMYGMFYPWRIRQVWAWIAADGRRVRLYGAFHAVWGALFLVLGALAAAGSLK